MDICLDKRIILNRYLYVIFKIHDSDMLIFSCAYTCCTLIPNTPPYSVFAHPFAFTMEGIFVCSNEFVFHIS